MPLGIVPLPCLELIRIANVSPGVTFRVWQRTEIGSCVQFVWSVGGFPALTRLQLYILIESTNDTNLR